MTRRILRTGIALVFLSCSSPETEPGPDAEQAEYRIKRILAQVDAGWFSDPDEPVARLAVLGRAALPVLKRSRAGAKPAAEAALQRAIDRIHATDPFFLVRAPDRRVTARLKSASRAEAYNEIFKGFPVHPGMLPGLESSHPVPKVAVWLNDSTYWETVRSFCQAFDVELQGKVFEPSKSIGWSRPHGPCIVSATRAEHGLTVRIHLEPGTQPIDGSLPFLKLVDAGGRNIAIQPEPEGKSFMELTANRVETTVGATEIKWPDAHDIRGPLTLTGVARVVWPTEIESTVWSRDSWDQDMVRKLGPWRIKLLSFDPFRFRFTSSGSPKAAGADAYQNYAWIFLSNDEGRSVNNSGFELGGGGEIGTSHGPKGPPYTRVTVVRPVGAEVVEFPFEIKGIR